MFASRALLALAASTGLFASAATTSAGTLEITNTDGNSSDGFIIANGKIIFMVKSCIDGKHVGFSWDMAAPNGNGRFACNDGGPNIVTYRTSGTITDRSWSLQGAGTWNMKSGSLNATMSVNLQLAIEIDGGNCRVKSFVYSWGPGPLGGGMITRRATSRSRCILKL